jgi:biopolymer transport protein ExbD
MNLKAWVVNVIILLFFLQFTFVVESQKKKPVKKAIQRVSIVEDNSLAIPEIKDFAFVAEIDENAEVSVRIQKTENNKFLASSTSNKNLTDFFTSFSLLQSGKTSVNTKTTLAPIVIVKADDSLNFGKIVEVIKSLRVSPEQKIKLQISKNYFAAIPPPINENNFPKPNPNFLLVKLQDDAKISLNTESFGDFNNITPLKEKLREIFKQREAFGILRPGTNEVEKTVFIAVPVTVKFSDVIKLIQEVADAGAEPIGVQIEELFPEPIEPLRK